jgi:hypothetical protein
VRWSQRHARPTSRPRPPQTKAAGRGGENDDLPCQQALLASTPTPCCSRRHPEESPQAASRGCCGAGGTPSTSATRKQTHVRSTVYTCIYTCRNVRVRCTGNSGLMQRAPQHTMFARRATARAHFQYSPTHESTCSRMTEHSFIHHFTHHVTSLPITHHFTSPRAAAALADLRGPSRLRLGGLWGVDSDGGSARMVLLDVHRRPVAPGAHVARVGHARVDGRVPRVHVQSVRAFGHGAPRRARDGRADGRTTDRCDTTHLLRQYIQHGTCRTYVRLCRNMRTQVRAETGTHLSCF